MLSHAFGTSSLLYLIDTIEPNLTEYLFAHGYDVWVLDYRASAALPASSQSFSIDDIATLDYPAAVQKIREVIQAESVQVVAHCVGAMALLMGLCAGLQGVRSAVISQLSLHPTVVSPIKAKAFTRAPTMLRASGATALSPLLPLGTQVTSSATTRFESNWRWLSSLTRAGVNVQAHTERLNQLIDEALKFQPTHEHCASQVCRRIIFIYGEAYRHDQLNTETHEAIPEMFGMANLSTLEHLSRMLRVGHVVDKHGEDVYLPHVARLALPLAFLHGVENRQFLPKTTEKTFKLLRRKNGAQWYTRHMIPRYGHMDCLVGKNAATDVFPLILGELQKGN
jgi:cholesterol oxidase